MQLSHVDCAPGICGATRRGRRGVLNHVETQLSPTLNPRNRDEAIEQDIRVD